MSMKQGDFNRQEVQLLYLCSHDEIYSCMCKTDLANHIQDTIHFRALDDDNANSPSEQGKQSLPSRVWHIRPAAND